MGIKRVILYKLHPMGYKIYKKEEFYTRTGILKSKFQWKKRPKKKEMSKTMTEKKPPTAGG